MNTLTLAFQALFRCEHCETTIYAGWDASLRCHVCERMIPLQSFWKRFSLVDMLDALTAPKDKIFERRTDDRTLFFQAAALLCQSCNTKIELSALEHIGSAAAITCAQCQKQISVRRVGRTDEEASPWVEWVVHEHIFDTSLSSVLFACLQCGSGILCDGRERIISCENCRQKNFLPQELWSHFHPTIKEGWFFVVFEFTHRPEIELRVKSSDPAQRREAAQMIATEQEALLFEDDEDFSVLEVLSLNPVTPASILQRLSTSSPKLKLNVANHPKTPLQTLETLTTDGWRSIRRAARNHPTYLASGKEPPPDPEDANPPSNKFVFQEPLPGEDPYRASPHFAEEAPPPVPKQDEHQTSWRNRFVNWVTGKKSNQ